MRRWHPGTWPYRAQRRFWLAVPHRHRRYSVSFSSYWVCRCCNRFLEEIPETPEVTDLGGGYSAVRFR